MISTVPSFFHEILHQGARHVELSQAFKGDLGYSYK